MHKRRIPRVWRASQLFDLFFSDALVQRARGSRSICNAYLLQIAALKYFARFSSMFCCDHFIDEYRFRSVGPFLYTKMLRSSRIIRLHDCVMN